METDLRCVDGPVGGVHGHVPGHVDGLHHHIAKVPHSHGAVQLFEMVVHNMHRHVEHAEEVVAAGLGGVGGAHAGVGLGAACAARAGRARRALLVHRPPQYISRHSVVADVHPRVEPPLLVEDGAAADAGGLCPDQLAVVASLHSELRTPHPTGRSHHTDWP